MLPPDNLVEMVNYINFRNTIESESSKKKEEIDSIYDNVQVLGEFLPEYRLMDIINYQSYLSN